METDREVERTFEAAGSSPADGAQPGSDDHRGPMTTSDPGHTVEADQVDAERLQGGERRTDDAAPPEPAGAPVDHQVTSIAVGAAAVLLDRLAPTGEVLGWRAVAVGAVFEIEDVAAGLLGRVRRSVGSVAPPRRWSRSSFGQTRGHLLRLAERGAAEQDHGRQRAASAIDSLVTAVATATVLERVVDAQVDRLLRPLVATILDDVLALLEEHPERVQVLIRDQREGMVNELVGRIRQSTATGDATVDRIAGRLFRRRAAPAAPVAPVVPAPAAAAPATAPTAS
jgi:hypothetical protein